MWTKVGLVRNGESLKKAGDQLDGWFQKLSDPPLTRPALETRNMIQVGLCIARAADWRKNSVGAHFREDFPLYKGTKWKIHSRTQLGVSPGPVTRAKGPHPKHKTGRKQTG